MQTREWNRRRFLEGLLAACGAGALPAVAIGAEAPDVARILRRGALVVAMTDFDVPPFFMSGPQDRFHGLDVSLAEGIAKVLGVPVRFQREGKTFNDVVGIVSREEADLAISKLSLTMARAVRVRFSQPYLVLRHGLLVNRVALARLSKGRDTASAIRDFSGSIGVLAHSSFEDYAKELFPKAKTVPFDRWEPDLVQAVSSGDVVMAYRDELEIKKVIRSNPTAALHLRTVVIDDTRDDIAVALPWGSLQLLSIVNLYLSRMKPLTVDAVLDRYREIFAARP